MLKLSEQELLDIKNLVESDSTIPLMKYRAQMMLLLHEGKSYGKIAETLNCARSTIAKQKNRWETLGLASLYP